MLETLATTMLPGLCFTMQKDSKLSILILASVTFTVFLEVGILKGFSVLLPTLKEQFSTQTWVIGSSISIIYGWGYSLGLSANMLKKRLGSRLTMMLCGILSNTGMIIVAVANNMYTFFVGILLLGFMLVQENIAVGAVPDYFDKYYNVAVGVQTLGTAIAIIVFPPITQFLLEIYGWRGTMLLFCGISLHTLPGGALFEARQDITHRSYGGSSSVENNEPTPAVWERLLILLKELDGSLFTSLPFICRVIIPSIVWTYTFSGWAIYIVSYALSFGSSIKQASIISTSGGIGMAAIRIVLPFFSTRVTMPYRQLMYIASLLMTLAMVLTTLFHSTAFLSVSSLIFGVGLGLLSPLIHMAIKDATREDQYVNAVAWYHLSAGFANVIGATITGAIFDATTSFIISFFILSAVSFGILISLGFEDIWMRVNTRKSAPL